MSGGAHGGGEDRSGREGPPERVRSTPGSTGPLPVRDLMKRMTPDTSAAPGAEAEPRWDGHERAFEREDGGWIARSAGAGAYGTGRLGTARLMAIHFYREDDPDTPLREALIPAGAFRDLGPDDLRALCDRATPIDLER